MGVVLVLRILRVTEFSKVRKSSAEKKNHEEKSWVRENRNIITGRNLSGRCDFNDDFLYTEGKLDEKCISRKWAESVAVCGGASTSDILIYDYFVSYKNVRKFWNLITVGNMTDNQAPVVQRLDNARINRYSVDMCWQSKPRF